MKKILYLGTDPKNFSSQGEVVHYPVIKIIPRDVFDPEIKSAFDDIQEYTHFIFTSKNGVEIFFSNLEKLGKNKKHIQDKMIIAIGKVTAQHLSAHGCNPQIQAEEETQEGIIKSMRIQDLEKAYIFFPKSSLSRPLLVNFLRARAIRHQALDLYVTAFESKKPLPDLNHFDEIVFTSPSTVQAFVYLFSALPKNKQLTAIGPITEAALQKHL